MEASRATPRAIWLSLLGALIAIACLPALLAGIGYVVPLLLDLARNARLWKILQILSVLISLVGMVCTLVLAVRKWKQSAPKR
jgi:cell division protein FtsX